LEIVHQFRPASTLTEPGPAPVDRNAHDPRPQRPALIPAPQTAKNAQENFLGNIFGVLAMLQHSYAEAKDFGLKAFHQGPDRLCLATKTATD
jgi:hypothetical protein